MSAAPVGELETDGLGPGADELDDAGALDADDSGADGPAGAVLVTTAAGLIFFA